MNNKVLKPEMREAFFMALYKKAFPAVARYVARMGGSLDEAQDIFQDTLIIYYEKLVLHQEWFVANEKAYLLGISKNLWLQHYKISCKNQSIGDLDVEAITDDQPADSTLLRYLETAGKKCMELLKACYYDGLTLNDVASIFNYSGPRSATVAKYKCLEKVRETVKQRSLAYADFLE